MIEPDLSPPQLQVPIAMETEESATAGDEPRQILAELINVMDSNGDKYEVASKFAQCEARQDDLNEVERSKFNELKVSCIQSFCYQRVIILNTNSLRRLLCNICCIKFFCGDVGLYDYGFGF